MLGQTRSFLRDLWALARPYWFSEERWTARGLLAVIVGMNLGLVYLNVIFNEWNNLFYNSLQNKDYAEFLHQLMRYDRLQRAERSLERKLGVAADQRVYADEIRALRATYLNSLEDQIRDALPMRANGAASACLDAETEHFINRGLTAA